MCIEGELAEALVGGIFNSYRWKNFSSIPGEVWDIKASIEEVAARSCCQKVVGVCRGGNLRTWRPAMKEAVKLKKEAFWLGWLRGLFKQQTGFGDHQSQNLCVGGVQGGLLVGLKDVLANLQTTQEGKEGGGGGKCCWERDVWTTLLSLPPL